MKKYFIKKSSHNNCSKLQISNARIKICSTNNITLFNKIIFLLQLKEYDVMTMVHNRSNQKNTISHVTQEINFNTSIFSH